VFLFGEGFRWERRVLEHHELINSSTIGNTHHNFSSTVMLFWIYGIRNLLCSNSRGLLVRHVLKGRRAGNIRLVRHIGFEIFHEDLSRFLRLIDVVPRLCRVERKFIWSPTDHISYITSVLIRMELGFGNEPYFSWSFFIISTECPSKVVLAKKIYY
jgi:hypothetical protein